MRETVGDMSDRGAYMFKRGLDRTITFNLSLRSCFKSRICNPKTVLHLSLVGKNYEIVVT